MVTIRTLPSEHSWSTYRFWAGTSVGLSVIIVALAPQYSVKSSYFRTATALFFLQWLLYGIYAVVIFPRFLSPLRHLPSPSEGNSFFSGQFRTIVREPSGIPMRRWANEVPNDGLIRYLHLHNRERLLVTSPKALAEVLNLKSYDFIKPELLRSGVGQILGIGILFAEGDEHKLQRKHLMPAFNFRHVKELYPIFWQKSREMVEKIGQELEQKSPESTLEVGEWGSRATLDIIGLAGMGQDFNVLADPDAELSQTYRKVLQPSRSAQILGLLQFFFPSWLLQNLPIKRNDDIMAASKLVRNTSRELIKLKKERMEKKEALHPDIISVALESGGFSEEQLVDNMMTFLAAGHETTASSFSWAILMLCRNPDVQTRVRDEIRQHISSLDSAIDHAQIDSMAYLHAVCNEVLRLYAPVPLTIRDTAVDTSILGTFIPKSTKLVLSPWATNYSKELWGGEAEEFRPERWMAPGAANSGGATSNYAFLTFLHGPRSCIGQRFAVAELACLIAAFVGRFEFEMKNPDEKIEIKGGITARPKHGMWVKLRAVEGW